MSGLLSFLAGLWGVIKAIFVRKNEADMVANKVAAGDIQREDENAILESRAAAGDAAAMEELRRKLSE